ncbi:Spermatogenesis-Associated Protein 31A1 [Manis pentadactyla]|nr:Spermatogenesis-Associated Protein 31A1 [Manis pentadactyla]
MGPAFTAAWPVEHLSLDRSEIQPLILIEIQHPEWYWSLLRDLETKIQRVNFTALLSYLH